MRASALLLIVACVPFLAGCTDAPAATSDGSAVADAPSAARAAAAPPDAGGLGTRLFVDDGKTDAASSSMADVPPPKRGDGRRHGPPTVVAGEVEVVPADALAGRPYWSAAQTLLVQNDDAGARRVEVQALLRAGSFRAEAWEHPGYRLVVRLQAQGPNESTAREAFASLALDTRETLAADHLKLDTEVVHAFIDTATPAGPAPMLVTFSRTAEVVLYVPPEAVMDLQVRTTSAPVEVVGVRGHRLDVATATGDVAGTGVAVKRLRLATDGAAVTVAGAAADEAVVAPAGGDVALRDATFQSLRVDDAASLLLGGVEARILRAGVVGAVTGDAVVGDLRVDGDAGEVALGLANPWGGEHRVTTTDGAIALSYGRTPGDGLDAFARSFLGAADVSLHDGQVVEEETTLDHLDVARERSAGFASSPKACTVRADSSTGDVGIVDFVPAPAA